MFSLKERLQQILLRDKIITQADLDKALAEQKKSGGELSKILVKLNFIGEKELTFILSEGLGIPPIDISRLKIDPEVVKLIPQNIAVNYQIMPISKIGDNLTLAMADPLNVFAIDNVETLTGLKINPIIGRSSDITQAIQKYYMTDTSETSKTLERIIQDIKDTKDTEELELVKDFTNT